MIKKDDELNSTDITNRKKYLVICRVGDNSLHKEWLNPVEYKNFDLFLDYFGSEDNRYSED